MKVLIANKFYYPRGGDCVCTLNLEKLLKDNGHETAVFAMDYPMNIPSEWSPYFATEVSFNNGISNKLKAASRVLGLGSIRNSFNKIITEFNPDIVHLNNIHSYLSPIIAKIAHDSGAKVVWTLHDYKLLCPTYSCLRGGNICEDCFSSKTSVLLQRCMKNSLSASFVAWMEAMKWNRTHLEKHVDIFICPSEFMREKMIKGGFNPDKLITLCNFIDPVKLQALQNIELSKIRNESYCYIGRLSEEKGIRTLLETAKTLPYTLHIAGDGPLREELQNKYTNHPNLIFHGQLSAQQVTDLLTKSRFSVIPSEWYENNPLSVIESLCAGTPVIGANIGGIPELIDNNVTGAIFTPGDRRELASAIKKCLTTSFDNNRIATISRNRFSPENHYIKLMKIYRN